MIISRRFSCLDNTHLVNAVLRPARPEQMRAVDNAAALVRLSEQFGSSEGTLRAQWLVVLFTETRRPLKRARYERDGGKLGLAVADLLFIQRERLRDELIGNRLVVLKVDGAGDLCQLEEETEGQLGHLGLDERGDSLVTELKDLLAFLVPLVVLQDATTLVNVTNTSQCPNNKYKLQTLWMV
jgi:hypothetical protein